MNRQLVAYVVAPIGPPSTQIHKVLADIGVRVIDTHSFDPGDRISDSVIERIRQSDFVVVYLESESTNVLFETGVAAGAQKPIALITERDTPPPQALAHTVHLRTSIADTGFALYAFLSRFAEDLVRSRSTRRRPQGSKSLGERGVAPYLERVRTLRASGSYQDLEKLVFDLLRSLSPSGVATRIELEVDQGVDAAIWSDVLSSTLGNPILVEVKLGRPLEEHLQEFTRRLDHYFRRTEARTALLFYLDPSGQRVTTTAEHNPHILIFDIEDFLVELQYSPFEQVLLAARNRIAHGGTR